MISVKVVLVYIFHPLKFIHSRRKDCRAKRLESLPLTRPHRAGSVTMGSGRTQSLVVPWRLHLRIFFKAWL